jgi:hypothetical protein
MNTTQPKITDRDASMHKLYPNCRVSIPEARELSWRKFFSDIGGEDNLKKLDGTILIGLSIKCSERCFLDILENKISKGKLHNLIALPPTETWLKIYGNLEIKDVCDKP